MRAGALRSNTAPCAVSGRARISTESTRHEGVPGETYTTCASCCPAIESRQFLQFLQLFLATELCRKRLEPIHVCFQCLQTALNTIVLERATLGYLESAVSAMQTVRHFLSAS